MAQPWMMMLNSGGMRSLVAAGMLADKTRLAMVYIHDGRVNDARCCEAFKRQVERYAVEHPIEITLEHLAGESRWSADLDGPPRMPMATAQRVLAAAGLAMQLKAQRLIWPVSVGADFEGLASITESITLIQHLAQIHRGDDSFTIETPLLEFDDKQLIEVGHQMDVPWQMARSCATVSPEPCNHCTGCRRRREAFRDAGIDDPLFVANANA